MKKIILFISLFIAGSSVGQTVTVQNNSTWFDLVIGGYNEYDCSSSNSNRCWTSACHQTPSMTTNSFTASVGSLVDASIYGLNSGGPTSAWQTLNTQVGCMAGGTAITTFTSPLGTAIVTWTDLLGGDVLIEVF